MVENSPQPMQTHVCKQQFYTSDLRLPKIGFKFNLISFDLDKTSVFENFHIPLYVPPKRFFNTELIKSVHQSRFVFAIKQNL